MMTSSRKVAITQSNIKFPLLITAQLNVQLPSGFTNTTMTFVQKEMKIKVDSLYANPGP